MLPIVRDVIEQDEAGEADGGVGFAEVEVDASGMGELGREYFVSLVFLGFLSPLLGGALPSSDFFSMVRFFFKVLRALA